MTTTELETTPPADDTAAFILCEVAGTAYAVHSDDVEQLEMVGTLTPVPSAPSFIDGVTSSRGKIIPVVNLRARFGFPRAAVDPRARIIVTRADGRAVGLLVDSAREFVRLSADALQQPPDALDASAPYLRGVAHLGQRLVLVLDVRTLLGITAVPVITSSPAPGVLPAAL